MLIMKVLKNDLEEIYKLVSTKAKFQKVMVLFDENSSNSEVYEIYNSIKEICIYNQSDIATLDLNELNNGYRMIVYLCSAKNFLKLNFDKSEFINLCIIKGKEILPFCVNVDNRIMKKNTYLLINGEFFDLSLQSSLYFNKFYNYLYNVVNLKENNIVDFKENSNTLSLFNKLEHICDEFVFADLDIISKTNIDCKHLCVLHLILINAFLLILQNVKNKSLTLVDVYKVCKDDYGMLDKFYAMAENELFYTMINLNYNYLINLCLKVKEEILNHFIVCDLSEDEVENIFNELKAYAKNSNNLIGYLFLYDFFKL